MPDWLQVLGEAVAITVAVGTALMKWLNGKLNGFGRRIKVLEDAGVGVSTRIADMDRKQQASEFDREALHREVGGLRELAEKNASAFEKLRDEQHRDHLELIERLTRMETNADLGKSLEKIGDSIVRSIEILTRTPPPGRTG